MSSNFDPFFENDYTGDMYDGRPRRTKITHPYSYDPITLYDNGTTPNGSVYTDRLYQWDYKLTDRLVKKHLSNMLWDRPSKKAVEGFLRERLEEPNLRLCSIVEWCNVATGYPTWALNYFVPEK